jgi:hypothetical protein
MMNKVRPLLPQKNTLGEPPFATTGQKNRLGRHGDLPLQYFIIFVIVLVLIILGCAQKPELAKIRDLDALFQVQTSFADSLPRHINVFMDGSSSMSGFTSNEESYFNKLYEIFSIPTSREQVQFYKFGAQCTPLHADFDTSVNLLSKPAFYNEKITNITDVFRYINRDNDALNLIFTDGVQTTENSNAAKVFFARNLKTYLGADGFFTLAATRGLFSGTYYSLRKNREIHTRATVQRPYYCMAFGNKKYYRFFAKNINPKFDNSFTLGVMQRYPCQLVTQGIKHDNYQHLMDDPSNCFCRLKVSGKEPLHLALAKSENLLNTSVHSTPVTLNQSKNKGKYVIGTRFAVAETDTKYNPKTRTLSFELPQPDEIKEDDLVFRLSFIQAMPDWIEKWSTNDDSSVAELNRTYLLQDWVRFILQQFNSDPEYITIYEYYVHARR